METRDEIFASTRPLLFAIAYRMLGSVMDAEDVVQDAWLKWQEAAETDVRSPAAYLTTIVTRLSINQLRRIKSRREDYVGPWLPEPLVTGGGPDRSDPAELAESLSMAFLVLLERLSPVERAVFLLHEVFDFEYAEIARIVDKTEANCRQLLTRARKHVGSRESRFEADRQRAAQLLERFARAVTEGDLDGMVALLAEDVTFWGDSGGKIPGAARKPLRGVKAVVQALTRGAKRFRPAGTVFRAVEINGQAGAIAYLAGQPTGALIIEIRGDRIQTMYGVANPEKLRRLPSPDALG